MMPYPLKRWDELRAKGRSSFIWRYGVLLWGLGTTLFFALVFVPAADLTWGDRLVILLTALVCFPLGGYAWGALIWRYNEAQYARGIAPVERPMTRWETIWRRGMLQWALPMWAVMSAMDITWDHGIHQLFQGALWLGELRSIPVFLALAVPYGLWLWKYPGPRQ